LKSLSRTTKNLNNRILWQFVLETKSTGTWI